MLLGNFSYDAIEEDGQAPHFPRPRMPQALETGELVRFFEHAFEWEKISYVLYPYFWGRRAHWYDKLRLSADDKQFQDFLRAGAARVVFPVRPGFVDALQYFFITGRLWGGGEPPQVTDPNYLPISEEIREQTGAPQGETPVDEPWEVVIPTSLIRVRRDDTLPTWSQPNPSEWKWEPDGS
jgi:hypothetical protein